MSWIRQPHTILAIAALLLFTMPLAFWGQSIIIDIIGFSVLVDAVSFSLMLAITLTIYWIIYKSAQSLVLSLPLTWVHILITIIMIDYFVLTSKWYLKLDASSAIESDILYRLMLTKERMISVTSSKAIIFILAQFVFIINLSMGWLKRKNHNIHEEQQ